MSDAHQAPELAGKNYVAAEHSGLEINHMADGGHAPEVVPNSYYAQEKAAADAYYAQQQGQWQDGTIPPQYEHGSPQSQQTYGYTPQNAQNAQYGAADAGYSATPAGAPIGDENPSRRLCGIPRKRALILIVVAIVAVIAIAVGVGVGVGVGSHKNSDPAQSATITNNPIPSASATAELGCPGANQVSYTTPDGKKTFTRYCKIDFGSQNGDSDDLDHTLTHNFTECMNACANTTGCEGVGWGWMDGDTNNLHNCYMKNNLKRAHPAVVTWNFAVLQPSNLTSSDLAGGGSNN